MAVHQATDAAIELLPQEKTTVIAQFQASVAQDADHAEGIFKRAVVAWGRLERCFGGNVGKADGMTGGNGRQDAAGCFKKMTVAEGEQAETWIDRADALTVAISILRRS